jgi:tetratricopeptide (TPR) repeat protein
MYIKLKPSKSNHFPIGGFLIKADSVKVWLLEIQNMGFTLNEIEIYPIPGTTANSVWGCFVITSKKLTSQRVGKHELCQKVCANFFIPEHTIVTPVISETDQNSLFSTTPHICHPEFGFVQLEEEYNPAHYIEIPTEKFRYVREPEPSVFIPKQIKSFQIKPVPNEDILKKLEEKAFPKTEKLPDTKLSILEKAKLSIYKKLFSKKNKAETNSPTEHTDLMQNIDNFVKAIFHKKKDWSEGIQEDFEDLNKRNQKEIDKLMELLKNNPEEALKYAIPLDHSGVSRGQNSGQLQLSKIWSNFSLFGNDMFTGGSRGSGGGSIDLGHHFNQLSDQYHKTAKELIDKKEYEKASFVYMKLLKDFNLAASTLENGKMYQEAAAIYLKHGNNKKKAAECYEKGNMTTKAIELYEEIGQYEKVGDLYLTIQNQPKAFHFFEKTVETYKQKKNYIPAALIYQYKMKDLFKTQNLLMEGWNHNIQPYNCLNHYLENINDTKSLKSEIESIYTKLTDENRELFLRVIQKEYDKKNELTNYLRELGYELIAKQIKINPRIASELKKFNKEDKEVMKDISRFNFKKK